MESNLSKGKLIKWKDEQGFGFIEPVDGSQKVFLHASEVKDCIRRPKVGDIIYYHPITEDGKIKAYNSFILGARIKLSSSFESPKKKAVSKKSSLPILEVFILSIVPLIGSVHFAWTTTNSKYRTKKEESEENHHDSSLDQGQGNVRNQLHNGKYS